jgi:hypothetical protein
MHQKQSSQYEKYAGHRHIQCFLLGKNPVDKCTRSFPRCNANRGKVTSWRILVSPPAAPSIIRFLIAGSSLIPSRGVWGYPPWGFGESPHQRTSCSARLKSLTFHINQNSQMIRLYPKHLSKCMMRSGMFPHKSITFEWRVLICAMNYIRSKFMACILWRHQARRYRQAWRSNADVSVRVLLEDVENELSYHETSGESRNYHSWIILDGLAALCQGKFWKEQLVPRLFQFGYRVR